MDDALPNFSMKYGRIASNTSGRRGLVALLSRYTLRIANPILIVVVRFRGRMAGFGIAEHRQSHRPNEKPALCEASATHLAGASDSRSERSCWDKWVPDTPHGDG